VLGWASRQHFDSRKELVGMPQDERRHARRYPVRLPVVITGRWRGGTIPGVTRDVSASGVFFYAKDWPMELAAIQFAMPLPAEVTGNETVHVVCDAMVMRVEEGRLGRLGIAAKIERYDLS
jgi:hypothetical protein